VAAFDYTGLIALSRRLVERFGVSGVAIRDGDGEDVGDAGWRAEDAGNNVSTGIVVVITELDAKAEPDARLRMTDSVALIAPPAGGESLREYHRLTVGGVTYLIVDMAEISPGGSVVLYKARVRR
jgi:hypothetical protein